MSKKTIFELFPGIQVYDKEPVMVQNRFGGDSCELTPRSEEHTSELQSH